MTDWSRSLMSSMNWWDWFVWWRPPVPVVDQCHRFHVLTSHHLFMMSMHLLFYYLRLLSITLFLSSQKFDDRACSMSLLLFYYRIAVSCHRWSINHRFHVSTSDRFFDGRVCRRWLQLWSVMNVLAFASLSICGRERRRFLLPSPCPVELWWSSMSPLSLMNCWSTCASNTDVCVPDVFISTVHGVDNVAKNSTAQKKSKVSAAWTVTPPFRHLSYTHLTSHCSSTPIRHPFMTMSSCSDHGSFLTRCLPLWS